MANFKFTMFYLEKRFYIVESLLTTSIHTLDKRKHPHSRNKVELWGTESKKSNCSNVGSGDGGAGGSECFMFFLSNGYNVQHAYGVRASCTLYLYMGDTATYVAAANR